MRRFSVRQMKHLPAQVWCVVFLVWAPAASAEEGWTKTIMLENDSFIDNSDRHYTNGLYFSATSPADGNNESLYARIANAVMLGVRSDQKPGYRYGYFGGQSMFTPQDLSSTPQNLQTLALRRPLFTDRPYAGWLFGGMRVYREFDDDVPDGVDVLDRAEVTVGIVGPASGAGDVQTAWHHSNIAGGTIPKGWGGQLANEPGLVLSEQRIWRKSYELDKESAFAFQALPQVTASVGNVFTYAGVGGMLRVGQNLMADWGPARMQPGLNGADFVNESKPGEFTWYLFAGGEERLVLRNVFLDGSTFVTSASVKAKQYVGDFTGGAVLSFLGIHLNLSYTQRTHEFVTQRGNDEFLSISASFQ